jgi:hypothetical protein
LGHFPFEAVKGWTRAPQGAVNTLYPRGWFILVLNHRVSTADGHDAVENVDGRSPARGRCRRG